MMVVHARYLQPDGVACSLLNDRHAATEQNLIFRDTITSIVQTNQSATRKLTTWNGL